MFKSNNFTTKIDVEDKMLQFYKTGNFMSDFISKS